MKKIILFIVCISLLTACDNWYSTNSPDKSSTGTGGSTARFVCKGNYLYVVDEQNLSSYDIADSSKIELKSRQSVGGLMETIFPTDSLLFMGSTSGMYIYNLKKPYNPAYISQYNHLTSCDPVVVQGKYAFVTLHSSSDVWSCSRNVNELQVIDISDIRNPIQKNSYTMVNPKGLSIDGNRLFICDGMDLVVMDASNPLEMNELKRMEMDGTPYDLIARNGLLTVTYSAGIKQYSYDGDTIQQLSVIY